MVRDWNAHRSIAILEAKVRLLEARLTALEEAANEDWDIPIECSIGDCGLVCNTEAEYQEHLRREHNAT